MIGMMDGQSQDAGPHPHMAASSPDRALLPAALAPGDFPGGASIALGIHQLILFLPAQHEAQLEGNEQPQPETAREATIKDMQNLSSKLRRALEKQFAVLIAFVGGMRTTTGPPLHGGQCGGIARLTTSHQDHRQPLQTRDENGSAWRAVVALFDVGEPSRFAGTHRAELVSREAFGLLPHTLIPDGQGVQPRVFPDLQLLRGPLPEKLPDQFGGPLDTMQQVPEAFGASRGFVRRLEIPAQFAEQQAIDAIAKRQDHRDGLQKGAHQSLVDASIQFDEQRGQKAGQGCVQALRQFRGVVGRNSRFLQTCEILSRHENTSWIHWLSLFGNSLLAYLRRCPFTSSSVKFGMTHVFFHPAHRPMSLRTKRADASASATTATARTSRVSPVGKPCNSGVP